MKIDLELYIYHQMYGELCDMYDNIAIITDNYCSFVTFITSLHNSKEIYHILQYWELTSNYKLSMIDAINFALKRHYHELNYKVYSDIRFIDRARHIFLNGIALIRKIL